MTNDPDIFNALAEPTRRTILEMLARGGQLSATAIAEKFEATPPAISQHLKVLRQARLVNVEKHAQQRLYRLNLKKMLELERWTKHLAEQWNRRFRALDNLLKK